MGKTNPEPQNASGQEPPMYLQRPSTGHSQDVRHILAKCFRQLYTRDAVRPETVKNLQVSKGGDDPYHERYVDSLQKVYTEWQRRMDEAAMLERHIMQAQARAMSADERELNRTAQSCDKYPDLGLPPGRSHFRSCIDTELLKKHNLLTPEDYATEDPMSVPPPQPPKVPSYARETQTSQQRSRHNEGRVDSPFPTGDQLAVSEEFPSFISDEDMETKGNDYENDLDTFPRVDAWKQHMTEEQREMERHDLANLQAKTNYLRNQRFLSGSAPPGIRTLIKSHKKKAKEIGVEPKPEDSIPPEPTPIFLASPPEVVFREYQVEQVYEIVLELKNISTVIRQCRSLPPSTPYFTVGLGQFPGEHGLVAAGMSCKYPIRFVPDSLKDFDDEIVIQTQSAIPLVIPLRGRRDPPILTLPPILDTGHCLVGGYHVAQFFIKNEGGSGRFCIMPRSAWPAINFKSVVSEGKVVMPPFDVRPSTFELRRGQSGIVEVIFNPHATKVFNQEITIACDNCQVQHFLLRGEGQTAQVALDFVERGESEPLPGELTDFSAQHRLVFDDLNPYTYTDRVITVQNLTKVDLPFQWLTYKPHLNPPDTEALDAENAGPRDRIPDLDTAFSVSPNNGMVPADEKMEFKVTFAPPMLNSFHSILHMVLQQVPRTSQSMRAIVGRSSARSVTALSQKRSVSSKTESSVQMKGSRSASSERSSESSGDEDEEVIIPIDGPIYCDTVGLEIEVKGKSVPLNIVLHPYAIFLPGKNPIGTTIKKLFTMANHSFSTITFQWQPHSDKHIIEVEPPFGELDPGMAMDLELSLTGVEPGKISTTLYCFVMNMDDPLALHIEAEMKGPEITVEEPDVNFGLVRLGQSVQRTVTLYNQSQLVTKWHIQDTPLPLAEDPMAPSEFIFSPESGELRPLERKVITVTFTPKSAQTVKRVLEIDIEDGNKSSIAAYAEVQSPSVCLKESNLTLPEVYLGVPCRVEVVLLNQGLIPTRFHIGEVEGEDVEDCSVEMDKTAAFIKPREECIINLDFVAKREGIFSDVRFPVYVDGMELPQVFSVSCDVRGMSVKFTASEDGEIKSDQLILHFGQAVELGSSPHRYLFMQNMTAINAPYTVNVDFMFARPPTPPEKQGETTPKSRRTLLGRTPNLADPFSKTSDKAEAELKRAMLSQGHGASFTVTPATGILQAYGTQRLDVTAYSNMWGSYTDKLVVKIGDMEPAEVPLTMTVVGCPLQFQITAAKPDQNPVVRFGTHVSGVAAVNRGMRINNNSPHDIRVDWREFCIEAQDDQLLDLNVCYGRPFPPRDENGEEIPPREDEPLPLKRAPTELIPNSPDTTPTTSRQTTWTVESLLSVVEEPLKVVSLCLATHSGKQSTQPFQIIPNQLVVPAYGHCQVTAQFTPLPPSEVSQDMECQGFAVGYLSVDGKARGNDSRIYRPEAFDAATTRLDMTAHLKPALLSIEYTEDEGMRYRSAMSDLLQDGQTMPEVLRVCSTMLSNNTETPLIFRLKVNTPFLLVDLNPATNQMRASVAMETGFHTLRPQHNLLVKVAFQTSTQLLDTYGYVDGDDVQQSGRKLEIQDDLIIEFNNTTIQRVPLEATLAIPEIELSKQSLDFGTCLVGQERVLEFFITNHTSSHSFWTATIENPSDTCVSDTTFKVLPSSGLLDAHITHVSNSKMLIKVHFKAKHAESYEAVFLFQGALGEASKRLYVRGQGSYDGKHEAVLNV
ncbi:deleted in lung and esophageal cancer protein 1-like [Haliotis cracherodii]|uniref:deleted in lung and esophageal cancer protein 1-like n=1 Tax=Haliotis cracherodii TaxID=6455 RepID=UPI0039E96579